MQNGINEYLNTFSADIQADCQQLMNVLTPATGFAPKLEPYNIIGFGTYRYKYESGREGTAPYVSFAVRKAGYSVYIAAGAENFPDLLAQLGKFKNGVSCLNIKKLSDINLSILSELAKAAVAKTNALFPQ